MLHSHGHSEVWAGSCGLRVVALSCGEVEGIRRSGFHPSPVASGRSLDLSELPCSLLSMRNPIPPNSSLAGLKGPSEIML